MPELEEECIFTAKTDNVQLTTGANGDILHITALDFNTSQAASMAWLVNHKNRELEFEVKLKV